MIEKVCLKGIHSCVLEILRQKGRKNRKKMGNGLTQLTMKPVFRSSVSSQRTLENTEMCSHSPSSRSLFPFLSFYFTLSYQSLKIALVKSLLKQWLLKMEYFAVKCQYENGLFVTTYPIGGRNLWNVLKQLPRNLKLELSAQRLKIMAVLVSHSCNQNI